ncbi:Phage tail-collar fibre protein, partial [Persephonella hydrogeniphila]
LVAIGNYPETYKPVLSQGSGNDMYIRFIMEVENVDSVQLKIDPAIVLASRKYVDDEITTHDTSSAAHADIRQAITDNISAHNTDATAHSNLFSISPQGNTAIYRENANGEFQIKDRATGIVYRLFVENGSIKLEVV